MNKEFQEYISNMDQYFISVLPKSNSNSFLSPMISFEKTKSEKKNNKNQKKKFPYLQ